MDSIAGGGGLITIPVLFSFGLPPQLALGTNKLQASFGSGSAAWHYARAKVVSPRECWLGVVFTVIGAAAGTWFVQTRDPELLKRLIPILLLAIAAYMIFKPELGEKDVHPRMSAGAFYPVAGLALGFYDGFLGPGTGSFWAMAFMLCLGFNLTRATGYTEGHELCQQSHIARRVCPGGPDGLRRRAGHGCGPVARRAIRLTDGRHAGRAIHPPHFSRDGVRSHRKTPLRHLGKMTANPPGSAIHR